MYESFELTYYYFSYCIESLNSNSYLTLLACISPHREDLSESLSTLRFAQNAKQLKNTPEVNNILADIKVIYLKFI